MEFEMLEQETAYSVVDPFTMNVRGKWIEDSEVETTWNIEKRYMLHIEKYGNENYLEEQMYKAMQQKLFLGFGIPLKDTNGLTFHELA